jgi:putative MFS transporter
MAFGSVAGALVGMALGDRVSRQWSIVGACLVIIGLGFVYPSMRDPAAITTIGFLLVTSIYTLVTLGLYAYIPELFPTPLRLRGTGVAGMSGRAMSIATPYLTIWLYESFGLEGVLGMVSLMLIALIAAIAILRIETGGVSLDETTGEVAPRLDTPPGGLARHA